MVLHASFRNRSLRRTSYLGDKICRTIFKLFLYFPCQSFLSEYNFKNGSPGIRVLIVKVEKKNSWEILSFPYFEGYISRVLNLLQAWVIIFLSFQLICFSFSSSKGTIGAPKEWNEKFCSLKKRAFLLTVTDKRRNIARCGNNVMRSKGCAVWYQGITLKDWRANDDLEQSRTLTIGFGIFRYEINIGYGVLSSFKTIVLKLLLLF